MSCTPYTPPTTVSCNASDNEILLAILALQQASFDRQFQIIQAIQAGGGGGGGLTSMNFVYNEIPAGVVNGVNTVFTLAAVPTAGKQAVYLNGVRQNPGAGNDYTIAGAVITFAVAPIVGSVILVDYIKP